jgi:hypothetical protein
MKITIISSRTFRYKKSANPRVVGYCFGAICIARPIVLISKKGNMLERYELAYKDITANDWLDNSFKTQNDWSLEGLLDSLITNEEFDSLPDKEIAKNIYY